MSSHLAARTRIVTMNRAEFTARFGEPDIAGALCGYTRETDTRTVLTLLCHARPRRVLEVGTAMGHMTANLTRWTPDDACVFTIDLVRGMNRAAPGAAEQAVEVPPRGEWGRLADAFGTGHKAFFITADTMTYDFGRLAPLDFAFIDGGHDLEHVLERQPQGLRRTAHRAAGWSGTISTARCRGSRCERRSSRRASPSRWCTCEGTEVAFLQEGESQVDRSEQGSSRAAAASRGRQSRRRASWRARCARRRTSPHPARRSTRHSEDASHGPRGLGGGFRGAAFAGACESGDLPGG